MTICSIDVYLNINLPICLMIFEVYTESKRISFFFGRGEGTFDQYTSSSNQNSSMCDFHVDILWQKGHVHRYKFERIVLLFVNSYCVGKFLAVMWALVVAFVASRSVRSLKCFYFIRWYLVGLIFINISGVRKVNIPFFRSREKRLPSRGGVLSILIGKGIYAFCEDCFIVSGVP